MRGDAFRVVQSQALAVVGPGSELFVGVATPQGIYFGRFLITITAAAAVSTVTRVIFAAFTAIIVTSAVRVL